MQEYTVAIFGAGIIGAFIFDNLTLKGVKCVLIEKNEDVSLGATKANSGIIHAGYDCERDSLKAKFNVRGNTSTPSCACSDCNKSQVESVTMRIIMLPPETGAYRVRDRISHFPKYGKLRNL